MDDRLQSKLRRLGVTKGARSLKPASPPMPDSSRTFAPSNAGAFERLMPGARVEETAVGSCIVYDKVYPLSLKQGDELLGALLAHLPANAAIYCKTPALAPCTFADALFLDTETTGLVGAGTLAFMVGVAFFDEQKLDNGSPGYVFVVRQYFLRDHGDESAMLHLLEQIAARKRFLVTFNGRSFDIPLLNNRYLLNRYPSPFANMPHFDLLQPARRLWRTRLGSCALGELEKTLLNVHRSHEDVPGYLIPGMYHDYVRTGDPDEMVRVFYHNHQDMLSMVTLATKLMRLLESGAGHPLDTLCLGRWQADLGLVDEAEQSLQNAIAADLPLEQFHTALHCLALLFKQNGRRADAVPLWQQIASTAYDDINAHVELAKFYEWHEVNYTQAILWTKQGVQLIQHWRNRSHARIVEAELLHRLSRLQRKANGRAANEQ